MFFTEGREEFWIMALGYGKSLEVVNLNSFFLTIFDGAFLAKFLGEDSFY